MRAARRLPQWHGWRRRQFSTLIAASPRTWPHESDLAPGNTPGPNRVNSWPMNSP